MRNVFLGAQHAPKPRQALDMQELTIALLDVGECVQGLPVVGASAEATETPSSTSPGVFKSSAR